MLDLITAIRFDARVSSGRTVPCRLTCEKPGGDEVEVVAKLSAGCDRGVASLSIEAIAAMLATDLDLPVPEPFLVQLAPAFIACLPDPQVAEMARRSSPMAFGSKHLPPGYTSWPEGKAIPREAVETAVEIFAFDALIVNPDRRRANPNCLFNGAALAIYDHELALFTDAIIGWQPPWVIGSLEFLRQPGSHLFSEQLRGKALNLDRFAGAWLAISDARLEEYRAAMPREWNSAAGQVDQALRHIAEVRDNIDPALNEVRRVLA